MGEIIYREPGTGAIEFAKQVTEGLTQGQAGSIISALLLKGELNDASDKRVKRCDYCGYLWRDNSVRNTKRTCCDDCKRGIKTLQRRQQRADKELLNPKPKKSINPEVKYVYWLEYPFWIHEYDMLKNSWKYEMPYSPEKISQIVAAKQRDGLIGGKRKSKFDNNYSDDSLGSGRVFVNFGKNNNSRKPCEVIVNHMDQEELVNYFTSKYSERHLRLERWRAQTWKKF